MKLHRDVIELAAGDPKDFPERFCLGLIPCPFSSAIFQKPANSSGCFGGFLERRIPGKNGGKLPLDLCLCAEGYES